VRRGALRNDAVRRQLAVLEERNAGIVLGELGHIHRLDHARRIDLLQNPILDVGDVVAVLSTN
jgi:hypothetical protein